MTTLLETNVARLIPESVVRKDIAGVSEATWYRMRKSGLTPSPAVEIGHRRFYRQEVIDAWLRSNEVR